MPSTERVLHRDEAARIAAERGFDAPGAETRRVGIETETQRVGIETETRRVGIETETQRVGIEMEWCTVDLRRPDRPADLARVQKAAAGAVLHHHSRISYEPGGQIELSTAPLPGLEAISALADDAQVLGRALARAGVGMVAIGLEPGPRRERSVRSPRYDAMESFFDHGGGAGRTMMRSSAALQLNLDLGDPSDPEAVARRWNLVHGLGPLLAAAFANSPFWDGRPSGWRSTRLAVWSAIDERRTRPIGSGDDCRAAWSDYALTADVMLMTGPDGQLVPVAPGLRFEDWIEHGHPEGWPTEADLDYHLTTLFPPVRPRGWLELRMIDALPDPWWRVAVAVGTVLVDDPAAAACAENAVEAVRGRWHDAARLGLTDPAFARAARTCVKAALAVLPRHGADPTLVDAVAEYEERFVARGRAPADELLEAYERDGTLLPRADNA